MIEFLKGWVVNIVTLAIFIALLEMIVPSGKVKKFISLVSGFILIIAIINPFLGLLKDKVNLKEFQIASSNLMDRKEIEKNSKLLKEEQMKQITELYRKKIIRQAEESAREVEGVADVKADVIINEDYSSNTFGEIKRIYLSLALDEKQGAVKPVARIERVEIGSKGAESEKKAKKDEKDVTDKMKGQIESKIDKLLDVQKENIIISLQRG